MSDRGVELDGIATVIEVAFDMSCGVSNYECTACGWKLSVMPHEHELTRAAISLRFHHTHCLRREMME